MLKYAVALYLNRFGSPAILGPSEISDDFSEEVGTRGFASLVLARFAFVGYDHALCRNGKIESIRRLRSKDFLPKFESGRVRLQSVARYSFPDLQLGARPTAASFAVFELGVRSLRIRKPNWGIVQKSTFAVSDYRKIVILLIDGTAAIILGGFCAGKVNSIDWTKCRIPH